MEETKRQRADLDLDELLGPLGAQLVRLLVERLDAGDASGVREAFDGLRSLRDEAEDAAQDNNAAADSASEAVSEPTTFTAAPVPASAKGQQEGQGGTGSATTPPYRRQVAYGAGEPVPPGRMVKYDVFIGNLLPSVTAQQLSFEGAKYGNVLAARRPENLKYVGFLSYGTPQEQQACIQALNGLRGFRGGIKPLMARVRGMFVVDCVCD
jgi:hypothetical protein